MYDYLIVGAGFYGAVCAHELHKAGRKVLVVDKRSHIGGNAYDEKDDAFYILDQFNARIRRIGMETGGDNDNKSTTE